MSCGVGRRHSSDLAWLWLWRRPGATAPIGPLAWELPYAADMALKKKKKKKKPQKRVLYTYYCFLKHMLQQFIYIFVSIYVYLCDAL